MLPQVDSSTAHMDRQRRSSIGIHGSVCDAEGGFQRRVSGERDALLECMQASWEEFYTTKDDFAKNIFGRQGLHIAMDAGVSDIEELDYLMMFVQAGLVVLFVVVNVATIVRTDLQAIYGTGSWAEEQEEFEEAEELFLLSKQLFVICGAGEWISSRMGEVIPALELGALCVLVSHLLWQGTVAYRASRLAKTHPKGKHYWELVRWRNTADLFWKTIPQIAAFSAMRLLYYVTPTVMLTHAQERIDLCVEAVRQRRTLRRRMSSFVPVVRHIAQCTFCLVVGFDAFLIKFRVSQQYIVSADFRWGSVFQAAVFLYQVLAVVNLNWFVRERLFIFIFGGEDGKVSTQEMARWEVWNALLAKEIFATHGILMGTGVMLGFDDYDFQGLVLDDEGKHERKLKRATTRLLGSSPTTSLTPTGSRRQSSGLPQASVATLGVSLLRASFDPMESACSIQSARSSPA